MYKTLSRHVWLARSLCLMSIVMPALSSATSPDSLAQHSFAWEWSIHRIGVPPVYHTIGVQYFLTPQWALVGTANGRLSQSRYTNIRLGDLPVKNWEHHLRSTIGMRHLYSITPGVSWYLGGYLGFKHSAEVRKRELPLGSESERHETHVGFIGGEVGVAFQLFPQVNLLLTQTGSLGYEQKSVKAWLRGTQIEKEQWKKWEGTLLQFSVGLQWAWK